MHNLRGKEISEWKKMTLSIEEIDSFVNFLKNLKNRPMSKTQRKLKESYIIEFLEHVQIEFSMVETFFQYNLQEIERKFMRFLFKINYESDDITEPELRMAILQLYKHGVITKKYANYNTELVAILNKKMLKSLSIATFTKCTKACNYPLENTIQLPLHSLQKIITKSFYFFMDRFAGNNKRESESQIKLFCKNKNPTKKDNFLYGFWLGGTIIVTLYTILFVELGIVANKAHQTVRLFVFPVYSCLFSFTLFIWALSMNFYMWDKMKINYRDILMFNIHYSPIIAVLKRTSFFTSLSMLSFMIFRLLQSTDECDYSYRWRVYLLIPSTSCWLIFLVYILMPTKQSFNAKGRLYIIRNLISTFKVWNEITIVEIFFMEQMLSLIRPITDFAYTICFYVAVYSDQDSSFCETHWIISPTNIISFLILAWYLAQRIFFWKQRRDNRSLLKLIKGIIVFLIFSLSIFTMFLFEFFYIWLFFSVILIFYSTYIDYKYDKNIGKQQFTSNSYINELIFYFSVIFNLIFRGAWILTFCEVITDMIGFEYFPFFLCCIEILRRFFWNHHRIEKEHAKLCEHFLVVKDKIVNLKYKKEREANSHITAKDNSINEPFLSENPIENKSSPKEEAYLEILEKRKLCEELKSLAIEKGEMSKNSRKTYNQTKKVLKRHMKIKSFVDLSFASNK